MAENKKKTDNKKLNKNGTITGLELQWEILLVYAISILGFIFAFLKDEKVSDDARFHYKQSGTLFIIVAGIGIVVEIFQAIFALLFITMGIFPITTILFTTLYGLFSIAVIVFIIITIVKGFEGENYEIPLVSKLSNIIWKK